MIEHKKRHEENIDFGLGELGLGGLFKGLGQLIDLASKVKEAGGEIKKEGELDFSHLKEGMKGVFGVSLRTAGSGKTVVEPFGNIKNTPKGPKVEAEREPITDVFDEKEEIRIYAEMPGVNEKDIKLDLKDDILDISAQSGDRKYHKEVLLPLKLMTENLTFSYKNGILEVKIKK
ncbi:Hsp20/alpha crystallin family protein [Candidatus Saganbacteria bacterium]|nr:Hsp20/alpha crystallin family protein [Candidatus Saganbacteria bacterium]